MERPTSLDIPGIDYIAKGREVFGQARGRLMGMLSEARDGVVLAISNIVNPPYPTPDGKPLELHWYEGKELEELNTKLNLDRVFKAVLHQMESKDGDHI